MKLLWVDDDKNFDRFQYEVDCIVAEGWQVEWATNLWDAAKLVSKNQYDVLFIDQQIPFEDDKDRQAIFNEEQKKNKNEPSIWHGHILLALLLKEPAFISDATGNVRDIYQKLENEFGQHIEKVEKSKIMMLSSYEVKNHRLFNQFHNLTANTKPLDEDEILAFLAEVHENE